MIERTKDRADYKIIVRKTTAPQGDLHADHDDVENAAELEAPASAKDELSRQAEELVKLFHRRFHAVDAHTPQTKELNQAISLVTTLGFEKARYVIRSGIDAYLADPKHQVEIEDAMNRHFGEIGRSFPGMAPQALESLVRHAVRSDVARKLAMISFEEFVVAERAIAATEPSGAQSVPPPDSGEGSGEPEASCPPPFRPLNRSLGLLPSVNAVEGLSKRKRENCVGGGEHCHGGTENTCFQP
jgi:hypothetical protein